MNNHHWQTIRSKVK